MLTGGPAIPPRVATLDELLRAAAESERQLIFLDASERETLLPYRALFSRARAFAAGLAGLGVKAGDRVALLLPTSPGFVESFFGTVLAGAIPVPLYPPVRLGRLDEFHVRTAAMLQAITATIVVTDERLRPLLGHAVRLAAPPLGCRTVGELASTDGLEVAREPESLAFIQFSSGSTVEPKPVALTHANVLANVAAIDHFIESHGGAHAGVSWLPLYHDMGLIGALLEALYHPGDLVLIPPEVFLAKPIIWLRAISRHQAEVSPAPNFAYGLCLKRVRDEDIAGLDLSSWRFALNGAEPVTPDVLRRFIDRFAPVGFDPGSLMPVYGLSEATLAVTFHARGQPLSSQHIDPLAAAKDMEVRNGPREVVSVGRPLAGVDIEIRDEAGAVLSDRRIGRIFVRGPGVMQGYFQQQETTAQAKSGGWLDTGDLGFTVDGELFISGRAKDVIILRGANHPPQVFEECLEGIAGIRTGCAVAIGFIPDEGLGEELALLVETDGDAPATLVDDIRGRVAERTGIRPEAVELLEPGVLPRTSSGKLRRNEARRQWLSGELRAPRRVTAVGIAWEMAKGQLEHLRARLGS